MDALHELIKSLTPSEKGYFKKAASRFEGTDGNNYLKLFDAIEVLREYDEAQLKKDFKGKKFLKQFSVAKNYLYESILKSLTAYHAEEHIEAKVFALFSQTQILIDKGLYPQAFKILTKGISIADEHELFGLRFQLHLLERKIYLLQPFDKEAHYPVETLIETNRKTADLLNNYTKFLELHYQQRALISESYIVKDSERKTAHQKIYNETEKQNSASLSAKIIQSDIRINYFSSKADYANSYKQIEESLRLVKKHPYFNQYEQISSVILYDLLLTDALRTGNMKAFEKHLKDFKKLEIKTEPVKISAHLSYARFALVYYDYKNDKAQLMKLVDETESAIKTYGAKIRKDLHLGVIIAFTSGLLEYGEYSRVLDWIELYKQYPKIDRHYDFQGVLLLFQLMAHYELNNLEFVHNILENVEYFLKKNKQKSKFEEIVLRGFKNLCVITEKEKLHKNLKNYLEEINQYLQSDSAVRNNVALPIFEAFIKSKLEHKAYHAFMGR